MSAAKKRFVLVGTGKRAVMFIDPIVSEYKDVATLDAICDLSQTRMNWHNLRAAELFGAAPVPTYLAGDFDRMIREMRPDTVIVCSMDSTHHDYIIRAMELGCDVICEKPMTIDAEKARAIFDCIARTGRSLRITHNVRYIPMIAKVRELIRQGIIGSPKTVSLTYTLDTRHGASYFQRWHREKDKSGGLLIHKASHHFDMINWWIDSYPKTVFAMGDLMFYGKQNAEARGEHYSYDRYTGEAAAKNDPFAVFLDQTDADGPVSVPGSRGLYLNAEAETGYVRDRNVFGDNITAEDVMALTVRYRNGVIFSYSLVAFSPVEGFRAAITGDKGRIEVTDILGPHAIEGLSPDEVVARMKQAEQKSIRVFPMFGAAYDVDIPKPKGPHGGGDELLIRDLLSADAARSDPLHQAATHVDGAAAVLMGIAANESIRTGLPVECDVLLKLQ
ncbi:Gfo/Idh/MocA family oxidoreductase [soil metagenome]